MVDLLRFLADSEIVDFSVTMLGAGDHQEIRDDKVTISLEFSDGSIGSIHYFANGASSFPKERLEIFVAGRTLQLNNFTKLIGFGWPGFRSSRLMQQDKGQVECAKRFVHAVKAGEPSPIPVNEIFEVADICVQIAENIRSR
jgi:predicted dehydrogenase